MKREISDCGLDRMKLYDAMIAAGMDVAGGRQWTLDPESLRFKHGVTLAELKVPYHMGGEDEACVEKAVLSLLTLLIKRYEYSGPERRDSAATRMPLQGFSPVIKDRTFRTDIFIADSVEKKTAETILLSVPNMDSAMLAVWLGHDGYGRKLIKWTGDLFDKALKDEARVGSEPTSYLLLLAVTNLILKKKELIKAFRIKGFPYEKVDLTVGLVLFTVLRCALADFFERLKATRASYYNPHTEIVLLSAIAPKPFLSIPATMMASGPNPYGISGETYEALLPYLVPFTDTRGVTKEITEFVLEHIETDHEVMAALRHQSEATRLRIAVFNYIKEVELPGAKAHEELHNILSDDRHVKSFLADPKAAAELGKALEDVKTALARDPRRLEIISGFQKFLASYKKSSFDFLKGKKEGETEGVLDVIRRAYAARFDGHVAGFVNSMRSYLADRREEYDSNTLVDEYTRGRLYRFSNDDRPVLKSLAVEAEGQLFIDMKDFSRKTLKMKEIAMVDFMKEYFYAPILQAAARYSVGSVYATEETGIRLTNMPGDAAIFSGGVSNLVALAKDIQRIIKNYRRQLIRRLPPGADVEALESVHRAFETRKDELKGRRDALMKALDRKEAGIEARLAALGEEEHRLESNYRDELEAAVKNELEAGLYIAYGTKSETAIIDAKDAGYGVAKVAIGEKINEAARGTSRNSMVRAKLEVLLENERLKRNSKTLNYAFDTYIDRIYSIKMPFELETAFEKLTATRKPVMAEAMGRIMINEFMGELKKIVNGEPFSSLRLITSTTDIYNKGQAISAEALQAYIRERRGTRHFFRKTVKSASLGDYIRETFFFPSDTLEFVFGYEVDKGVEIVEGFCRAGEVIFKGFEANTPVVIYEIMDDDGFFFKSIVKQHFKTWREEAERGEGTTL
ncbi:MAG: hypothetical protein HZB85_08885 [Deltaproteobacteria bacterium]|nr:hypothetical protein [Deltaproteobacteria bacterium]